MYADKGAAVEAMADLRGQLELCGPRHRGHQGDWVSWQVERFTRPGRWDDALHLYLTTEAFEPGRTFEAYDTFVTSVRVGNAIYVVERDPGGLLSDPALVAQSARAGEAEVAAYASTLCAFAAGGCSDG